MSLSSIVGDVGHWLTGGNGHPKPAPPPTFDYRSRPVGGVNAFGVPADSQYDKQRQDYMRRYGIDPTVFNPSDNSAALQQRASNLYDTATAFNPQLNTNAQRVAGAQQQGLANLLMQRASGQSSVTAEQLRQAGEDAAQQAYGLAQANSAYNPGLALQMGQNAAQQARLQALQQGRIGALQEQQQAQGLYGELLGQMRGQASQEAGMGLNAQLQAQQLRQSGGLSALGAMSGLSEADRNALIAREQLANQANLQAQQLAAQRGSERENHYWQIGGGLINGLGSVLGNVF